MIDYLRSLLSENQFLSGGLILGLMGTIVLFARRYVSQALVALTRQCLVTVEIRNQDAPFDWLIVWLDQQPYTSRARRLSVSIGSKGGDDAPAHVGENSEAVKPAILFSPAVGFHLFLHHGRPMWLQRNRQEPDAMTFRERESFQVTMIGRSQQMLRGLLHEAYDTYLKTVQQQSRVFLSVYSYWRPQGFVRPRSIESVILPDGQQEVILADIRRFLEAEEWYHGMGIPYRRGYLLSGVPGSGKSSLVAALAGAVGMHLYVVNLPGINDSELQELLQNISSPRAIVLFEDIDVSQAAQLRDKTKEKARRGVTVSGLLNALDGVASRDGYVTMMTTNRRETLDPSLTRAGRVDMELKFDFATVDQVLALYARFYGAEQSARHERTLRRAMPTETSMATLQEHFLRHRDDPATGARLDRLLSETRALKVVADA